MCNRGNLLITTVVSFLALIADIYLLFYLFILQTEVNKVTPSNNEAAQRKIVYIEIPQRCSDDRASRCSSADSCEREGLYT